MMRIVLRFLASAALLATLLGVSVRDTGAATEMGGASGRIAYSDGNVCLVNADGSGRRCLTRSSGIDYAPVVWSADGRRLAFERHHDGPGRDCCSEVLIIGADGKGTVKLTPRGAEDYQPDWSPTAPRIAFTRRYGYSAAGVYVANADGSHARELMPNANDPSWSPDGRRIAFTAHRPGVPVGVYVMNADGANAQLFRRGVSGPAAWSPDGQLLLIVDQTPGLDTHVFVMNANGSGLRRVTTRCNEEYHPTWSPDGQRIAFSCSRKAVSYGDIYTVNVNGTGLLRLTSNPRGDNYPAWSPDGQWIAYVGYKGEENGVWVMRANGTEPRRITPSTHDSVPTWAPRRH